VVKKNDYPKKNISKDGVSKEGVQISETANPNIQQKPITKEAEVSHKDSHIRSSRSPRDSQQRENGNQSARTRNYHRDNPGREGRENRETGRQHFQRTAIKPRAEETVEDIAADIVRIQKEIELELKEIRSLRLGV